MPLGESGPLHQVTQCFHICQTDNDIIIKCYVRNQWSKGLLWRSVWLRVDPGPPAGLLLPLFLFLLLESAKGQLLTIKLINIKCRHTPCMNNTHSFPWCGGTLINNISGFCFVFEKESQWVIQVIGIKKRYTGPYCPHPTSLLFRIPWLH